MSHPGGSSARRDSLNQFQATPFTSGVDLRDYHDSLVGLERLLDRLEGFTLGDETAKDGTTATSCTACRRSRSTSTNDPDRRRDEPARLRRDLIRVHARTQCVARSPRSGGPAHPWRP